MLRYTPSGYFMARVDDNTRVYVQPSVAEDYEVALHLAVLGQAVDVCFMPGFAGDTGEVVTRLVTRTSGQQQTDQ